MKKTIHVQFVDFWPGFSPDDNFLTRLLSSRYDLRVSDDPELLFYSAYGKTFHRHACARVFYTGECVTPNFDECDFALSFEYLRDARNYRFPLCFLDDCRSRLLASKDIDHIAAAKTRFCGFVYGNPWPKERIRFFRLLSAYRPVHSAGRLLNNTPPVAKPVAVGPRDTQRAYDCQGNVIGTKAQFMRSCRFAIAFENSSYPGYTTEKLVDAMLANTVPIYWGNPRVAEDFNPKSFVNCHDYRSFRHVVDRVAEIDQDDRLYRQMLAEPVFRDNTIPRQYTDEALLGFFDRIVASLSSLTPVARTRRGRMAARTLRLRAWISRWRQLACYKLLGRFVYAYPRLWRE